MQPSISALAKARKAAFEILKVVERKLVIDPFSDAGLKPDRSKCQVPWPVTVPAGVTANRTVA